MKMKIGVIRDLCEEMGMLDAFHEVFDQRIVFFIPHERRRGDKTYLGWDAFVAVASDREAALTYCVRTDGHYQVAHPHSGEVEEVRVTTSEGKQRARYAKEREVADARETWEEALIAFQAKHGRPMSQLERALFMPRGLQKNPGPILEDDGTMKIGRT